MKEYPILCDKIECYKKERGCNPMKKDRLIVLTDAVLAIIMTILILELEKPTTPSLEAFWDLRQNFFACFLSFFWLGSLWMALNTLWEKVRKFPQKLFGGICFYSWSGRSSLWRISCHPRYQSE